MVQYTLPIRDFLKREPPITRQGVWIVSRNHKMRIEYSKRESACQSGLNPRRRANTRGGYTKRDPKTKQTALQWNSGTYFYA